MSKFERSQLRLLPLAGTTVSERAHGASATWRAAATVVEAASGFDFFAALV